MTTSDHINHANRLRYLAFGMGDRAHVLVKAGHIRRAFRCKRAALRLHRLADNHQITCRYAARGLLTA